MLKLGRALCLIGIIALFAGLVAACGSGNNAETSGNNGSASKGDSSTQKQSLSILYQYANDENKAGIDEIINQYKEQNPTITVNTQGVPLSQFYQVLQTRVSANDLPDVVFAPTAIIPSYAALGVLGDLTPYLPEDFFSTFSEVRTSINHQNGMIVGVPIADSIRGVIYNKTAFDKAGIEAPGLEDEPWTWDQLTEAAKKLQEAEAVRYGLMFEKPSFDGWLPFLFQNGGALVDEQGQPAINNAAGVEAIEWTVNLHKEGIAAPGIIEGTDDPLRLFVSGQVGMWLSSGTWNIPTLEEQVQDFEYSVTYMPQQAKNTTIIGGNDLVAFKTQNVETAAHFIEFAVSPDIISIFTNSTASFPPRTDANNIVNAREDLVPIFSQQGQFLDGTLNDQYFKDFYGKTKDQMLRELQSAVIGQQSPQETADKMAAIIAQELK
ncbi:ABC transporter substrate-binding protein [Paenibacillus abyssi]|uniref:Sugar ABC transporter substrate-binding protein n=1 Tax=Paenibacillus abyssi TaxID=1340531 RepID=A0A917CZC9_9BACL|nr:sugar ABC transporter substrate-binding protein [Paenibacillus abyssi]GGG03461.1 sugar ABC transporter substrate-binding protein [Paenibacillus abyssi]